MTNLLDNIKLNVERYLIFINKIDDLPFPFDDSLYIEETLNYHIYELYNKYNNDNNIISSKKIFERSINKPIKYKRFLLNILPNILLFVESKLIIK
tara:strand:- start:3802 stop:4089 length:288 start_codon:yes stop_codon:yes gene_type:complete